MVRTPDWAVTSAGADAARESEAFRQLDQRQQHDILERAARKLSTRLKEVSEDNVVGASASVAAGRLNMQFDFKGPHSSVDAGFASSYPLHEAHLPCA